MKSRGILKVSLFVAVVGLQCANISLASPSTSFTDDFEDGDTNGWWLGHNQSGYYGNWRIESGELVQDRPGDGYVALVENLLISSQTIETQLKVNPPSGYGGIMIWYQDTMNWTNVRVYPAAGQIWVHEVINGSSVNNPLIFSYDYITHENTWYNLKVDVSTDGELAVYVDNNYLFTYQAGVPYQTGLSGLFSGNAGGYFDDFKLTSNDIAPIPAPSALILGSIGVAFSGWLCRRKKL